MGADSGAGIRRRRGIIKHNDRRENWMEIVIFVEPLPTGYRASTQSPIPLTALGPSADEAVAALRAVLVEWMQTSGQVRALVLETAETNGSGGKSVTGRTNRTVEELIESSQRLAADPQFNRWVQEVEEYRRANNTIPDPD
jgi:hypothetical protein